jgi:hypothetical protein
VLGDTPVRPGRVVRLVLGQDGAQMPFAEDQHAVEGLSAQGSGEPLADRVHVQSLDGGAQDSGSGGLEDGADEAVKSGPRSRIRNLVPSSRSPGLKARLRGCCTVHSPAGLAVTPPSKHSGPWARCCGE